MIICRAPLRMSFVGGGSDLPIYFKKKGGAVLSTSIDKYVYVTVNKKFDSDIRLSYSVTENVNNAYQIRHPIVRNTLKLLGITNGIEITSVSDIPSLGSGLGSSSSFTVALVHALYTYKGEIISKEKTTIQNPLLSFEMDFDSELGAVVFDEIHYISDEDRGSVWEQ